MRQVLACDPAPNAIYVHVDAGDDESTRMVEQEFGQAVTVISSESTKGPGGGRNLLIARCTEDILVSLDDDSWPMDHDFFGRVQHWMTEHPDAAALAMMIVLRGQSEPASIRETVECADFENCGVAFRRCALAGTTGFLPLRYAYAMEESDLRLQLLDRDWRIFHGLDLRVYHDTEFAHHPSSAINAANISNLALLGFLRYPVALWPLAGLQVLGRLLYCLRNRRWAGMLQGILSIPSACLRHRRHRKTVAWRTVMRTRQLQRSSASRISGQR